MTEGFWSGFEKRAISLTGMKAGLRSGKRNFSSFGQIARSQPKAGIAEAPRAVSSPIPSPAPTTVSSGQMMLSGSKSLPMPKIPKPAKQVSRGVSSTNI